MVSGISISRGASRGAGGRLLPKEIEQVVLGLGAHGRHIDAQQAEAPLAAGGAEYIQHDDVAAQSGLANRDPCTAIRPGRVHKDADASAGAPPKRDIVRVPDGRRGQMDGIRRTERGERQVAQVTHGREALRLGGELGFREDGDGRAGGQGARNSADERVIPKERLRSGQLVQQATCVPGANRERGGAGGGRVRAGQGGGEGWRGSHWGVAVGVVLSRVASAIQLDRTGFVEFVQLGLRPCRMRLGQKMKARAHDVIGGSGPRVGERGGIQGAQE